MMKSFVLPALVLSFGCTPDFNDRRSRAQVSADGTNSKLFVAPTSGPQPSPQPSSLIPPPFFPSPTPQPTCQMPPSSFAGLGLKSRFECGRSNLSQCATDALKTYNKQRKIRSFFLLYNPEGLEDYINNELSTGYNREAMGRDMTVGSPGSVAPSLVVVDVENPDSICEHFVRHAPNTLHSSFNGNKYSLNSLEKPKFQTEFASVLRCDYYCQACGQEQKVAKLEKIETDYIGSVLKPWKRCPANSVTVELPNKEIKYWGPHFRNPPYPTYHQVFGSTVSFQMDEKCIGVHLGQVQETDYFLFGGKMNRVWIQPKLFFYHHNFVYTSEYYLTPAYDEQFIQYTYGETPPVAPPDPWDEDRLFYNRLNTGIWGSTLQLEPPTLPEPDVDYDADDFGYYGGGAIPDVTIRFNYSNMQDLETP